MLRNSIFTLKRHKYDAAFVVFLGLLICAYWIYISQLQVPMWDGAAYLNNARAWLNGSPLVELFRPPLISWLIAGIWFFTGENWVYAKPLSALFAVGAGILLYLTLRRHKSNLFSLGVTVLTMLNPIVFFYSTQIYTETLSLCFLLATLYLLKSERPSNWVLAGITLGLTFASRYPIVLQAGTLAVVEAYARKNWRMFARVIVGAIPVMGAVVLIVFLKTGTFQTALNPVVTFLLSPYYIQNSIVIWGWIFAFFPLAFILRGTYRDRYNWVFICWYAVSMVFWSANATNTNLRFAIQFTPAVYFLALSALEAFLKTRDPFRVFLRRELLFLPRPPIMQSK